MGNSYPQKLSTGDVDKPTHRGQYLTELLVSLLYLKQYLLQLKQFVKLQKLKNLVTALKNGIALLIVILTINQPISATAYDPSIESYKIYAHIMLGNDKQYQCLVRLWTAESHWNYKADNPKSTAYGIPQLLNMTSTNPYRQIELGYAYIKKRYDGNSCKAEAFHKRNGFY